MLSRLERRVVVGVIVAGLLVLAGGITAFVQRDRLVVWLTGDEVAAAQRTAMTAELAPGLEDDPTLSACNAWNALRCAWSDASAADAAQLLADTLADAGLKPGGVVCGGGRPLAEGLARHGTMCVAEVPVAGERLRVEAVDQTIVGGVPLGRSAVWIVWDDSAMSAPMTERLQSAWGLIDPRASRPRPTAADVVAALPARFAPVLDAPCRTETPDGCMVWQGPIDLTDLGDIESAVPRVVAELTAAGFFVGAADPDLASNGILASRILDVDTRRGVGVSVTIEDGVVMCQVLTI